MYDYTIQGQPLRFGNSSALYESDMVIFDHETGSYWQQVNGRAIVGPLMGERLLLLPAQTTTWALWKDQFPDTQVLSRDTGHVRRYDYDPFLGLAERLNRDGDAGWSSCSRSRSWRVTRAWILARSWSVWRSMAGSARTRSS